MDQQWQGCLAPVCQLAFRQAHGTVVRRGGDVVTPEDLLLALLDVDTALVPFLNRWGVDLDELIRTVQCEQPLAPQAGDEDGFSTALIDWLASARERYETPWLGTRHLLSALVIAAERFINKAYVAVLEQVPADAWDSFSEAALSLPQAPEWQLFDEGELVPEYAGAGPAGFPLSASGHDLATDIAARLVSAAGGLLWLQCSCDTRIDWIIGQVRRISQGITDPVHRDAIRHEWYSIDWPRAGASDEVLEALFAAMEQRCLQRRPVVFLLRECSPTVLVSLIQRVGVLRWRHMLAVARPFFVITSARDGAERSAADWLLDCLGLQLRRFEVPLLSMADCLRYLRFRQSALERQWRMEIDDSALQAAARLGRRPNSGVANGLDVDPALAHDLLRDALNSQLIAQANGPAVLARLRASREDLERKRLLAEARSEQTRELVKVLDDVCLELAAEEVHWAEQNHSTPGALNGDHVIEQARRNSASALSG